MRGFLVALGMFTILPVGHAAELDRRLSGRVMAAFPWAGLVVGAAAGAVLWAVALTGVAWLPAVLGIATLAWLTGGLHLDGVADTADGLGARRPADEALLIMRRSDIGPMGVITLVLVLLADVAALGALPPHVAAPALAVAAVTGRLVVVQATRGPGARSGGFGALFTGVTSAPAAAANSMAVLLVALGAGWLAGGWLVGCVFAGAGMLACTLGWGWRRHLAGRLGGMTGDTFGSLVEVTQTVFLVAVSLAVSATAQF